MKTHKLFLLALTALCSLGVWAVDASWRTTSLPGTSGGEMNGITLKPLQAPSTNCNLFNAWGQTGYVFNSSPKQELTISTTDALQLDEVTVSIAFSTNSFLIEFYDGNPANNGELLYSTTLTGSNNGTTESPCTINNIPDGAHFARITDGNPAWNHYLYDIQVTTKAAAATNAVTYKSGEGQGADVVARKVVGASYTLPTVDALGFTYANHILAGWKSSADNNVYPAGETMIMGTSDVTYTAQWKVGAIAHWRLNESGIALPGTAGATQDGITLTPSSEPIPNGNVFGNGWSWRTYRFNSSVEGANAYVALSTPAEQQLAEVTVSIRNNSSVQGFYIEFYDEKGGELLGTSSLTGTKTPATEQPCTISSIPEDSHYALIKTSACDNENYLYDIQVTTAEAPVVTKYTVSFAAGGATGTVPADMKKAENKTYTLPQPTGLTYTDHVFTGWKSSVDNNVYPARETMIMGTSDVTYTAQWAVPEIPTTLSRLDYSNYTSITGDVIDWNSDKWINLAGQKDVKWEKVYIVPASYKVASKYGTDAWGYHLIITIIDKNGTVVKTMDRPTQQPGGGGGITDEEFEWDLSDLKEGELYTVRAQDAWNDGGSHLCLLHMTFSLYPSTMYTISYNMNEHGTQVAPTKVQATKKWKVPADPSTEGFSFLGWKRASSATLYKFGDEGFVPTEDEEVTAQWGEDLDDPTITFRDTIYVVDESNLDLSKLFKSNSTGAVTYSVKEAGATGAAISGSVFTATASGTAIVTASQARVEGEWNAASVNATITVKAYATSANFMELMANYGSSGQYSNGVATELNGHYYAADMTGLYWDYQPGQADGGLGKDGEILLTFLVKANQKVTITLGTMGGDYYTGKAQISQNGGAWTDVAGCTSQTAPKSTDFTTTQETTFQLKSPSGGWSRIHAITITDMSPKTVSFDTHGGTPATIEPLTEESFGAGITLHDAPTKTDYIFDGWYTAATGGILAGNAGATYKPADNCTLHAHWVGYAKTVDFMDAAKRQTPQPTVADFLAANNYTMSPLRDAKWDDNNYGAPDAGLKVEDSDRDFSFWVAAGKQVTIQLGTWQGNYEGANKPELYANGEKLLDLKTSQQANDPIIVTEDTKFVIKIVNPWWSSIQIITIEDAPLPEITISDQAEDNSVLVANEGKTVNVQLERALTGGMFNTLCLPFDLSAEQIAASDLAGAQIVQLVSTSLENQKLYLEYEEVDTIVAGKGYLIAPVADVTNPSFEAVTISKTEATIETIDAVTVNPTFIISEIPADPANLYLYLDNTLYYPNNDLQIDGLRLYYHVNGEANLMPARMRMVGRGTPTDINIFPYEGKTEIGSAKFIHKGHLYILKGGKLYNAQGQIAK